MRKPFALLGSGVFFVIAPGTVAGLVPWWISRWRIETHSVLLQIPGAILLLSGLCFLLDSFVRFAVQGLGTPAPVLPTRHLVVTGLYRYVRNPMYLAVLATILGQALWLGNRDLFVYAAVVALGFHLFVTGYEEPTLRATFGAEYERFCAAVPRWIPKFR